MTELKLVLAHLAGEFEFRDAYDGWDALNLRTDRRLIEGRGYIRLNRGPHIRRRTTLGVSRFGPYKLLNDQRCAGTFTGKFKLLKKKLYDTSHLESIEISKRS